MNLSRFGALYCICIAPQAVGELVMEARQTCRTCGQKLNTSDRAKLHSPMTSLEIAGRVRLLREAGILARGADLPPSLSSVEEVLAYGQPTGRFGLLDPRKAGGTKKIASELEA